MKNIQHTNSLKNKTMTGLWWSFTDLLIHHGIQFGIQILLARLLVPEHFGMIGMILIFIAISDSLIDSGFTQALIRDQQTTQVDYSTVFYFNLLISILAYCLLFITAPSISVFFGEPQLIGIIRVLTFVMIVKALGIVPKVMLVKNVDFKTMTKVSVIAVLFSGSITITAAFIGFGVWSLVVNMISLQVGQTLFLWIFNKWLPSLTFSIPSFRKYFKFSYKLLLSGLLDTFYNNVYFLIIGRLFSTQQLGYYTNAVKVEDIASLSITATVQRVTFPVLSTIQTEEERLKSGFRFILRNTAYLHFPLMIGLAAIAKPLFIVLLGEKWLPSVIYFQLLCLSGMLFPLHSLNLNILQVKGRSDLFLLLEIIKKIVFTILIGLSLLFKLGIIGLITVSVIHSYFSLVINAYFSAREIEYSSIEQIKDLLPSFFISILMGIIVYQFGVILPGGSFIHLCGQISLGIVLYILFSKLSKIKEFDTMYQLMVPIVHLTINRLKK